MKIKEFEKLDKKINGQNFHESYKNINSVMTGLSYFGHLASIFLAFFMLSKILLGVMDNKVVVYIATIIVLSAVELLKRDIFGKFAKIYLKLRSFTKDVLPLFFLSIAIIGISFYSSLKGASEYSSKSDKIEADSKDILKKNIDSLSKPYELKISLKEKEVASLELDLNNLRSQQRQLNDLALAGTLTPAQKKLLSSLPRQIKEIELQNKPTIDAKNSEINKIKEELKKDIKIYETEHNNEKNKKKDDNSKNSIAFVIFSTLIEIAILAGVYFNDYYDVRSHREKKAQIEKDPGFQKWKLYSQILGMIYTEDTKMNQKLPSGKSIIDMCKTNDIIILNKDLTDFLKIMATLGIIKVSGSTRYINKQRDLSFEALDKHFNID
jgi:hypothetical protein